MVRLGEIMNDFVHKHTNSNGSVIRNEKLPAQHLFTLSILKNYAFDWVVGIEAPPIGKCVDVKSNVFV